MKQVDTDAWTGEGTFTPALLEALKTIEAVAYIRIEDAPSSRTGAGYAFISNEIYVRFRTREMRGADTLERLGQALGAIEGIGEPDYIDEGMLQYLRTERVVPPYQTKGTKVVEMVRIYRAGETTNP